MSTGYFFEDLQIGQTASLGKTITEADILMFAAVSAWTPIRSISMPKLPSSRSSGSAWRMGCSRPA